MSDHASTSTPTVWFPAWAEVLARADLTDELVRILAASLRAAQQRGKPAEAPE